MLRPIIASAFFILASLPAFGQAANTSEPVDLTKLRESWQRARQQAIAPLDKKYLDALAILKTKFTKAGQLDEALAIDSEIKKLQEVIAQPDNGKGIESVTKRVFEKKLQDTVWELGGELNGKGVRVELLSGGAALYHDSARPASWRWGIVDHKKGVISLHNFTLIHQGDGSFATEKEDRFLYPSKDQERTKQ
jgi:hypothetical protein